MFNISIDSVPISYLALIEPLVRLRQEFRKNIVMQREAPREIKNLSRTTSFRTLNSLAWPDPWIGRRITFQTQN